MKREKSNVNIAVTEHCGFSVIKKRWQPTEGAPPHSMILKRQFFGIFAQCVEAKHRVRFRQCGKRRVTWNGGAAARPLKSLALFLEVDLSAANRHSNTKKYKILRLVGFSLSRGIGMPRIRQLCNRPKPRLRPQRMIALAIQISQEAKY